MLEFEVNYTKVGLWFVVINVTKTALLSTFCTQMHLSVLCFV